ncbi:DUF5131 family protein [Fusobacterium perfoetens]|uniref:DUF5131 family protein n=1 Tax=Fusobacterium perfoetens TaxID=852 RepID=UPI000484220B|nr:phage Gp37/Gp68 family protein [Fusobacterium perfoetens]
MSKSRIEWTEETWNPITGCTPISEGCKNCYAKKMAKRLKAMGNKRYINGFVPTFHEEILELPLKWKKSRMVFVNSMSDIFHENIKDEEIEKIFKIMNLAKEHTFQVLTKRSKRMVELSKKLNFTDNIWMGVTVENKDSLYRINDLLKIKCKIKFLSCEPLLEDLEDVKLKGIDWVIVGGESGTKAREIKKEWVENLLKKCREENISFFFKQWGGFNKKKNGNLLNGKQYLEYPKK